MSDIKSLLKEARKFIDEKNFKDAQECCKNILRKDKQNYLALVLLGKSFQESDQAPLAFQKAIATKPDQLLAWQGLANFYEKKEDEISKTKLIHTYNEILKLQLDEEKTIELITKLIQLGCISKEKQAYGILISYIDKKPDEKLFTFAVRQLLELIKANVPCSENDIQQVVNCLMYLIEKDPSDSLYIVCGKVIFQKENFKDALQQVMTLSFFSSSVAFREWVCKYLCMYFIQNDSFGGIAIETHMDKITQGIENSKYPGLLKSMISFSKNLYLDAYKQCVPLINYNEADVTEATFIIKCTIFLKKWTVTQKLSTNFLMKVKDNDFAITLKKYLFLSLAEQNKWKQAISVAKEIPSTYLDINEQAALAKCFIESDEQADNLMVNLQPTEHYKQLEALLLIKQGKYSDVIVLLQQAEENSLNLFYIGKAHWELKQYDKCHVSLLKAAKLDAEHSETFLYLGRFYCYHKEDFEKARKCFEKAYSLNNMDKNVIDDLSNLYIKLDLKETDFELLKKADQCMLSDSTWISFRLGLHYINRREWENAILQFRNVIKNDHNNVTAFECLADSYYSRGSFTSALKAYSKVIAMDSSKKLHCLTRIGYIHSLLMQYEDAIIKFEEVFQIDPYSLMALKGIAEAWMKVAKKKFAAKLYGSARDTAQKTVDYLMKALYKEKKYLCFWNLLADALIFITKLPDEYSFVYMKSTINNDCNELARKDKIEIYPQALACYSKVIKQKQQFTSYELACTYLSYYLASKDMVNCEISYKLTIALIKLKPLYWRYWNLLGKICIFMEKYALAQHCFIKALLVTRKWSIAKIWCNLGTLYIKMKLYKLANYCFWRGQSTLPSYPQSWIGQALIAEVIREEEAMDLFRHASRLGYHPESALGYADWVCRTLKNDVYENSLELKYVIEGLHAIPYTIDLLTWFSTFEPTNACANNILGILQERSGLLSTALETYQRALQYAADDKKNIILLNIGRAYLRLGKYDEAIKTYKAITEASLNSACGLALTLFKKGLYEESYSAYDTALHWLSNNDDEKADILVAMSGIVYMFKGVDDAKTLLFHSIQVSQKKPTAFSLFAICSLGIIHMDQSLSKLALSELQKYEKESCYGYDIGFLKSYLRLDENLEQAIKILSDSLHDHPNSTLLWFCMSQYCLRTSNTKAKLASCCAQKALCSAHSGENDDNLSKIFAAASIAENLSGNRNKALSLAKEGLHMYPSQSDIWAALLFSILSNKVWSDRKNWILNASAHVRKNLEATRALSRWINLLEKKLHKQYS